MVTNCYVFFAQICHTFTYVFYIFACICHYDVTF